MAQTLTPTTGYIAFVGPDAWSHLRSLGWYAAQRADGVACVFATDDLVGSKQAAEVLRRIAAKRWPRLKLIVPGESSPNTTDAFARRFADWKAFHPELIQWVIDATAATLPVREAMTAALLADPAVTLVARERDGSWWQVVRDAASRKTLTSRTPPPPADAVDNGPLTDLIEPFCHGAAEVLWRESRAPLTLTVDELVRMVGAGVSCNWNWREMVEIGTGAPCHQYDYDLRDFVATALNALGVAHVRLNVRLAWTALKEDTLHLDVAACHNGRLYLFDCQTSEERNAAMSPQAAETAGAIFARLDVTGVVIRPNRWVTGSERTLSALAPSARLLDADACRQLFSRLGALLDIPVPAALREAERTSLRFGGRKLPVMTAASDAQRVGAAMKVDDRIYDVWRGAHADDASTDWPWRAARVTPDRWFLQGRVMQGGTATELRNRLAARFTAEKITVEIRFFELSGNRRYWHALLAVPGDAHLFPRWLRKWENVPLIV